MSISKTNETTEILSKEIQSFSPKKGIYKKEPNGNYRTLKAK